MTCTKRAALRVVGVSVVSRFCRLPVNKTDLRRRLRAIIARPPARSCRITYESNVNLRNRSRVLEIQLKAVAAARRDYIPAARFYFQLRRVSDAARTRLCSRDSRLRTGVPTHELTIARTQFGRVSLAIATRVHGRFTVTIVLL